MEASIRTLVGTSLTGYYYILLRYRADEEVKIDVNILATSMIIMSNKLYFIFSTLFCIFNLILDHIRMIRMLSQIPVSKKKKKKILETPGVCLGLTKNIVVSSNFMIFLLVGR